MTRFTEKATAITPSRELQPDEYFNETDHLIYCSSTVPKAIRQDNAGMIYRERFLFLPSAVNASRKSLSRKKPRENFMKNKWK